MVAAKTAFLAPMEDNVIQNPDSRSVFTFLYCSGQLKFQGIVIALVC